MTLILELNDLNIHLLIVLVNKHVDKSSYFIKGYVEGGEMGFFSYEQPQVVRYCLDIKGNVIGKNFYNISMQENNYIRDIVTVGDNVAVINNAKQLIVQVKSENELHNEMMNFYH